MSQRALTGRLQRLGAASRVELAQCLDLRQPTRARTLIGTPAIAKVVNHHAEPNIDHR
jgi:hypothetical protein